MDEKTVEKIDDLFLSLSTQILVYDGTNNFKSIVNDFNELCEEWLRFKESSVNKLTINKNK